MQKILKIIGGLVLGGLLVFLSYQYALVLLVRYQTQIAQSVTQLNQQEIWNKVYSEGSISINFPQLNEKKEVLKDEKGLEKFVPVKLVPVELCSKYVQSNEQTEIKK